MKYHIMNVKKLLGVLQYEKLSVNMSKSKFGKTSLVYLGFMVGCVQLKVHQSIDGGKTPLQQRETLHISQVPIRLMNIWCGRLDGIMDLLPY